MPGSLLTVLPRTLSAMPAGRCPGTGPVPPSTYAGECSGSFCISDYYISEDRGGEGLLVLYC